MYMYVVKPNYKMNKHIALYFRRCVDYFPLCLIQDAKRGWISIIKFR